MSTHTQKRDFNDTPDAAEGKFNADRAMVRKMASALRDCKRLLRYHADYANERATVLEIVTGVLEEYESR